MVEKKTHDKFDVPIGLSKQEYLDMLDIEVLREQTPPGAYITSIRYYKDRDVHVILIALLNGKCIQRSFSKFKKGNCHIGQHRCTNELVSDYISDEDLALYMRYKNNLARLASLKISYCKDGLTVLLFLRQNGKATTRSLNKVLNTVADLKMKGWTGL